MISGLPSSPMSSASASCGSFPGSRAGAAPAASNRRPACVQTATRSRRVFAGDVVAGVGDPERLAVRRERQVLGVEGPVTGVLDRLLRDLAFGVQEEDPLAARVVGAVVDDDVAASWWRPGRTAPAGARRSTVHIFLPGAAACRRAAAGRRRGATPAERHGRAEQAERDRDRGDNVPHRASVARPRDPAGDAGRTHRPAPTRSSPTSRSPARYGASSAASASPTRTCSSVPSGRWAVLEHLALPVHPGHQVAPVVRQHARAPPPPAGAAAPRSPRAARRCPARCARRRRPRPARAA